MENKKQDEQKKDNKKEELKVVETIIIESVKPFGIDAPIPTDRQEIKRQLGFKR